MSSRHRSDAGSPVDAEHTPYIIQLAAPQHAGNQPVGVVIDVNIFERGVPEQDTTQNGLQLHPEVIRHPTSPCSV